MKTISTLKTDLAVLVHSGTLSKLQNVNNILQTAGRTFLSKCRPPETIRSQQITNVIHDKIYDYTCPSDLYGNMVIDIRPQVNRTDADVLRSRLSEDFDLTKPDNTFSIKYSSGVKSLRLSKAIAHSPITLHNCNSLTGNGTWTAGGDASNLTLDTLNYISGGGCLNFDLAAAGTSAYIENSDIQAVDLSDQEDIGELFAWVYLPKTSIITSITLYWGSSSTAYWSETATAPHDQTSFKTGWNLVRFEWNDATETGSPDSSAIDYLKVLITYSSASAETDLRVDNIVCSTGEIWEIEYYSECLFQTSGGTWQTTITDDSNYVNLDDDGYNIYLYECGISAVQHAFGENSPVDINFLKAELKELYDNYRIEHPSQAKKPIQSWI